MNPRAVAVESASFRLVAKVNGRVRCPIFLYDRADAETPLAAEDLNTAASVDRERFLARLSAAQRDEVTPLLTRLASQIAAVSIEAGTGNGTGTSQEPADLEPWDDAVSGIAVLNETGALVTRYVILAEAEVVAISLWVMHTYLVDAADYSPYLHVSSPVRECGKSTLLELLSHVAFRARKTDSITPAAVYRLIDQSRPTLLLDELDARLRSDGAEALRGVLNSGFARGGKVTICVGDDHEVRDYSTYGPKVLAGIGRLWDTVTSRSIPIRLARAAKRDLVGLSKIRGHLIADECLSYRRKLLRLADDMRLAVRMADPMLPAELGARQADVWRPLLAIADAVGGHWPETARAAALQLHGITEDEGDIGLLLLEDVRGIFAASGLHALPSAQLVAELVQREDRPWPEYRHDKPISPRGLASLLGRFGVRPKAMRIQGAPPVKGYELSQLRPVFATYLTSDEVDVSDVSDKNQVALRPPLAESLAPKPLQTLESRPVDRRAL